MREINLLKIGRPTNIQRGKYVIFRLCKTCRGGGGYILNLFADTVKDIEDVSNGKKFITKNGTDYGVPKASSTIVITYPDRTKRTYVMGEDGEWREGGGGSTVQPDYNQNDPTQPDYIKNRPFYTGTPTQETIEIFNGSITTEAIEAPFMAGGEINDILVEGETVTIKIPSQSINDTKVVAKTTVNDISVTYIGNGALLYENLGLDTGESYLFATSQIIDNGNIANEFLYIQQTTFANLQVEVLSMKEETIHQMSGKFIKDMYYAETEEKTVQIVKDSITGTQINEGKEYYATIFLVNSLLIAGKSATIKTSQGLEETQVVKSFTDDEGTFTYIGNLGLTNGKNPNTGETYVFVTRSYDGQVGIFGQTTPYTDMQLEVSQVQTKETVVKMPSKYLPDEAATKSDIAEAITTTLNTAV